MRLDLHSALREFGVQNQIAYRWSSHCLTELYVYKTIINRGDVLIRYLSTRGNNENSISTHFGTKYLWTSYPCKYTMKSCIDRLNSRHFLAPNLTNWHLIFLITISSCVALNSYVKSTLKLETISKKRVWAIALVYTT